jgi:hypothetical protein
MSSLRIHPAIGVARVGNSQSFFVGPEHPGIPGNWDPENQRFKPFKDGGGVLRQAARFRVFEFDGDGNPVREVTLDSVKRIEWRVHVANRKASFFAFNGQRGAETDPPYAGRASEPTDAIEKVGKGRGQPERRNRRNHDVSDRRSLEIDPGEVSLSSPGSAGLIDSTSSVPIKELGQIQMDSQGRLLFIGGSGQSACSEKTPRPIDEYANNDRWFDDICDGPVRATVTFTDGHTEEAQSAWVIVGPPDFAPGIGNVVSLYDTLWDMAVRLRLNCAAGGDSRLLDLVTQQQAWRDATKDFDPAFQPSFLNDIYPILSRALAVRDTHEPPLARKGFHGTLADWPRLSSHAEDQIRRAVFKRIRNPNSDELNRVDMPRGHGDEYSSLDAFESGESAEEPSARAFLSLTAVQYALLKVWAEGRFREDWSFGDVRFAPVPAPGALSPAGLDRAALENCVGGPFFPGIEVGWLIRRPDLYTSAFRLREVAFDLGPLPFRAGFFSQQMALPWHADFYDCHKEEHTPEGAKERLIYMWWTAQRPDDIRSSATSPYRRWVEPFDAFKEEDAPSPDDLSNLARFEQMRTKWFELSFVVLEGDEHVEQK